MHALSKGTHNSGQVESVDRERFVARTTSIDHWLGVAAIDLSRFGYV